MLVQSTGIGLTSPCPESPCLHGRTSAKRFSLVHESPALQEQPLRLVTGVLMASIFGITNCFVCIKSASERDVISTVWGPDQYPGIELGVPLKIFD